MYFGSSQVYTRELFSLSHGAPMTFVDARYKKPLDFHLFSVSHHLSIKLFSYLRACHTPPEILAFPSTSCLHISDASNRALKFFISPPLLPLCTPNTALQSSLRFRNTYTPPFLIAASSLGRPRIFEGQCLYIITAVFYSRRPPSKVIGFDLINLR